MTKIAVSPKEQAIALKIVGMLRDECKDDLIVAVKALALANQMFQTAFAKTVNNFSGLQGRINGKTINGRVEG